MCPHAFDVAGEQEEGRPRERAASEVQSLARRVAGRGILSTGTGPRFSLLRRLPMGES